MPEGEVFYTDAVEAISQTIREVVGTPVEEDGVRFDAESIDGTRIKEDADYQGVRVKFYGYLERARIPMQIDVGFGDVVHPQSQEDFYPGLLDLPRANLRLYPRETVVAEKFHAMVILGTLNSRMKDFFDLWMISSQFEFQGGELVTAIRKTFENRATTIDSDPIALTPGFTADEKTQMQWKGFVKRMRINHVPESLNEIRVPLRAFLIPLATAATSDSAFEKTWTASEGWR